MLHPLVELARKAIAEYLLNGTFIKPPAPMPSEMGGRAGVFVSLKKKGELRGCIGTYMPSQPTLAEEVIQNAVSAAIEDPRFVPVSSEELPELSITVDVLEPPERVESRSELDPKIWGVIVQKGALKGLLLPDLPGVDELEEQIDIARKKAGIPEGEDFEVLKFRVTRYR